MRTYEEWKNHQLQEAPMNFFCREVGFEMKHASMLIAGIFVAAAVAAVGQDQSTLSSTEIGSSATSQVAVGAVPSFAERHPRYRLRQGDSFDIDFTLSPEFNQTVAVQPDGYATLKGVGTILIQGQTIPELTETLKTAYGKVLHDPMIMISLKDF